MGFGLRRSLFFAGFAALAGGIGLPGCAEAPEPATTTRRVRNLRFERAKD
jgi:hypothetical protein